MQGTHHGLSQRACPSVAFQPGGAAFEPLGAGACTALVSMAASTKAWIVGWLSSHETNKANTALAIQPYYLHINGYPAKSFALMAIQPCAAKLPSNLCRALPIQAIPCPHEAHPVALLWLHPSQLCTSLHHTSHRPMGPMARRASSRTGSSFVASSSSILQVAIQPCTWTKNKYNWLSSQLNQKTNGYPAIWSNGYPAITQAIGYPAIWTKKPMAIQPSGLMAIQP